MEVIVLDGNQRSALAVTRSLGKKGIKVTVGAESVLSFSSCSKYCSEYFLYPSPYRNPNSFLKTIKKYIVRKPDIILLPMTDITVSEVLEKKDDFGDNIKIPFVDYDQYIAASDKVSLFLLAKDLNIPMPRTLFPSDFRDRKDITGEVKKLGFPLVIKPAFSRIRIKNGWINASVRYAKDVHELRAILNEEPFKSIPFIIQERINGPGLGIFLLMQGGKVLAQFAHRRIREKPPSGGVSVLCESIEPPPIALNAAIKLLQNLHWFGVAMVEFKEDMRDNIPKLIEVNARFWGSLQLAVSAGVDFPYLLYRLAEGKKINSPTHYKIGIKSRWELGDLDHLLIRMREKSSDLFLPPHTSSKFEVLKDFIVDFLRPSVKNEVFRLKDPGPFFFELKEYIKSFIS